VTLINRIYLYGSCNNRVFWLSMLALCIGLWFVAALFVTKVKAFATAFARLGKSA
jgi:hypothetical protein